MQNSMFQKAQTCLSINKIHGKIRWQIAFFLLAFPVLLMAQPTKPAKKGEIETEEIVIEKSRAITLPEAERNFEKVTTLAKKPENAAQKYEATDRNLKLADLNTKFRILQMTQEPAKESTGNYLKAALGNYMGIYGDAFFGSKRNDAFSWNARGKFLSFGKGPVNGNNSATQESLLSGNVKFIADALTASAGLEFKRDLYHFYGSGVKRDRKDIRQVFSTIALKTAFANNKTDSPLDYKLNLNVFNTKDAYNASEFEFNVNLDGKYRISDALSILTPSETYFTRLQDSGSVSRNLFRSKPQLQFSKDAFTVTAGLNIATQNDTTAAISKINIYPIFEAQVTIGKAFTVFGGFTGDVQRNYFRQIVGDNPFVNNRLQVFNASKISDLYGGIKRQLGGALSFDVRTSIAKYRNLYFFTNSLRDTTRFDLTYETGTTGVFNLSTEVAYDAGKKFRIAAKADFYKYTLKNLQQPWHRPTFTATVMGRFAATESLFFTTEIYYLGGIQAPKYVRNGNVVTEKAVQLDPIADVNLKTEYIFLEKFSAYLSLNNLLSSRYQRFQYYQNRGATAILGATFSF